MARPEDKLHQLERTILELGTEVFRIRSEVSNMRDYHANFIEVIKGLKSILDEKGLITADDFDNAVELGHAITGGQQATFDPSFEEELNKIKKSSH